MSIQANINQGISLAGFLIQTNPAVQEHAKTRRELKTLTKAESKAQAQWEAMGPKSEKVLENLIQAEGPEATARAAQDVTTTFGDYATVGGTLKEIAERRFKLDPSPETYEKLDLRRVQEEGFSTYRNAVQTLADEAAKKAQDNLVAKQNEKRASRRNFAEYHDALLKSQGFDPTKIPKETKTEMMKQYSKSERKKIMDKEDTK